jgi:mRNA interferase MazF
VERGEVWWFEPPDEKRRPVLVMTRSRQIAVMTRVTVADITTRRRGNPIEVALDEHDGMPRPCVVSLDNLRTVPQAYLHRAITRLGPERMDEVCRALKIAVDC